MTVGLTFDEQVRALMAAPYNFTRERAEHVARLNQADRNALPSQRQTAQEVPDTLVVPPATTWPLRFVIPWSRLCTDNEKYAPTKDRNGQARIILTGRYRDCKAAVRALAREAMGGAPPLDVPLRLQGAVFFPDARTHAVDATNCAKLVHDACESAVYVNDRQLYDARWYRAGVDVDRPRAEITITPMPETAQ